MAERRSTCEACGDDVVSGKRGRVPKWCPTCRARRKKNRAYPPGVDGRRRENRSAEELSELGRRAARARWGEGNATYAYAPRRAIGYADCGWCGSLYVVRRSSRPGDVPCCRRPECRRAKQTARVNSYIRVNPEAKARYNRSYRESHPEQSVWNDAAKAAYARRRARKKTGHDGERIVPREAFERDGWCCGICSEPVDPALAYPDRMSPSLDHVVPLACGGLHVLTNVQLAHLSCNVRKGDRLAA